MIRLIATDLDGTFLDSSKQFSEEFFEIFEQLKQHQILFVIASGNQYDKLYDRFKPISEELSYIADNGCLIARGKEIISYCCLKQDDLSFLIYLLIQYPLVSVLSGKDCAYIDQKYKCYDEIIDRHYSVYQYVDDLTSINQEILKISVYCPQHNNKDYYDQISKQLPSHLRLVTAGNEWMDLSRKEINKGIALKQLMQTYDIQYHECAAFGDQMNDYEMLQEVKYAYAMGNAVKEIKNISYEVILTNDEQGVIYKLKEILKSLEV